MYVRVRDRVGHEFSHPEGSPLIASGFLTVVPRKGRTHVPLPPKFKKILTPLSVREKIEEANNG